MRKLLMLTVIFSALVGLTSFVYGAGEGEENEYIAYEVQQGDTLWSIAHQVKQPEESIRNVVYDIKKANDIKQFIQPGDVIKIPARNL